MKNFFAFFKNRASSELVLVLEEIGGGINKRIDENREMLELLQKNSPEILQEHPYIQGWLKANDDFFTALDNMAHSLGAINPRFKKRQGFPRSWPKVRKLLPDDFFALRSLAKSRWEQGIPFEWKSDVPYLEVADRLVAMGLVENSICDCGGEVYQLTNQGRSFVARMNLPRRD